MKFLNCQKDYLSTTITVYFDGDYDYKKMIEYVKNSYPNEKKYEVIEIEPTTKYKGFKNIGRVLISCI